MHVSLDSALGRQRRLNSVGESVLQIAPNAAAAYSLRSLTGGDPKVVRVRRASDNGERDFTSSDVTSGEMLRWVNAQAIKPLDIQALEADGRTGDFLIAKAAYSLRSLGTRQATLAATGDTVARADGKFVAQVRRSSDNALKSFTANEVSDGTLVNFVTESITGWNTQPTWNTIAPSGNIRSQSSTASTSTLTFFAYGTSHTISDSSRPSHIVANEGDVVDINLTVSNIQGSASIEIRAAGTDTALASSSTIADGTISASFTVNNNANGGAHIVFSSLETLGDLSDGTITINSVTVTGKTGFVKTWYDQSVTNQAGDTATGNHAVQATAGNQPLIVSAGSLVADNGIDFDGSTSSRFLVATSVSGLESPFSIFSTSVRDAGSGYTVSLSRSAAANRYFAVQEAGTSSLAAPRNSTSGVSASDSVSGNTRLTFALTTGATSTSAGALGSAVTTTTDDYGDDFTSSSGLDQIAIGLLRTVSPTGYFDGRIREIIVYTSDQTDNRIAIEANIGEAYSIDLPSGVDPGFDQVDGFVDTWYDQSGNNRPLIQTTASEQPLIVEAGVFLNGVKSNKATSNDTMQNLQVSTDGINANFGTDDWASGASSKLGAVYVGTVSSDSVVSASSNAVILGGGRAVSSFQSGGVSLQVIKAGNDNWKIVNERQGLSPSSMLNATSLNTDADVILYGTTDNREFTINVNGSGDTETESADLDVREDTPLSLFGAYATASNRYYQRSSGGVCKECYLYAGDPIANIPALATSINAHYSIY